jgi:hypothetical protein
LRDGFRLNRFLARMEIGEERATRAVVVPRQVRPRRNKLGAWRTTSERRERNWGQALISNSRLWEIPPWPMEIRA